MVGVVVSPVKSEVEGEGGVDSHARVDTDGNQGCPRQEACGPRHTRDPQDRAPQRGTPREPSLLGRESQRLRLVLFWTRRVVSVLEEEGPLDPLVFLSAVEGSVDADTGCRFGNSSLGLRQ